VRLTAKARAFDSTRGARGMIEESGEIGSADRDRLYALLGRLKAVVRDAGSGATPHAEDKR
jgi:hypothetical protein